MKKLVILSAFLSPYRSGAEAMVEEVSVRLADKFDITIVTARMRRDLPVHDRLTSASPDGRGEKTEVKIIRVGFGYSFDKWLYPFLAPMQLGALKPDIIHAVLETFAGLALFFCRCHACKILTLQTTNRTFLKGMIIRYPDIVTAISSDLVRTAVALGRNDVLLIPNGIDLPALQDACKKNPKDSSRVLFVGRLEPMKGIDTLLRAFAKALTPSPSPERRGENFAPDIHLRIVGDGSQKKKLQELAVALGIDHRVTFAGYISGSELFTEYAKAEIFVGLSRSEALGNVFLEAQAAGCAVLATNVGGIPDIVIHEQTGILVPVDDSDAAATELCRLLMDTELRARLSIAAQKNAEKYGWDDIADRYLKVLTK